MKEFTLKNTFYLIIFLAAPFWTGCAAVALSGATMGAGYNFMNTASKTSNYPLPEMHAAVTEALQRMDIKIEEDNKTENGREIVAVTDDLSIDIELNSITFKTTRMTVDASKIAVVKDRATAVEIIAQTQNILEASEYNPEKDYRYVNHRCRGFGLKCADLEI